MYQSNWNVRLKVQLDNVSKTEQQPDKPYQALGRANLFKWFMKSSLNLSEEDAWRARHMAQYGESAESIPLPELKEAYSKIFQQTEKRFEISKDKTEVERLATLRREIQEKKIKVTRVHEVMAEMIPCSASYVASALSDDKGKLDAYNRGVVAYKAKQFFSIYEKIQQEKRKLFSSQ